MSDEDLERQRVQAEIAKLEAETTILRRQGWSKAADVAKVIGAVVATIAGLYAVITTYRITQLETRLAVSEREQAERERSAATLARDRAQAEVRQVQAAKASVERELATLVAKVQSAQQDIVRLTGEAPSRKVDLSSLRTVSGNLESASENAARSLPFVFIVPARPGQSNLVSKLAFVVALNGARAGASSPLRNIRNAPAITQLHFFKESDRAEAERLAAAMREAGVQQVQTVLADRPEITRFRYYELRLPIKLVVP